jgi:nitrogen fixation NifU-like protein
MDDLYQEMILDHYKNPRHYGKIEHADLIVKEANASCGDSFSFYFVFEKKNNEIQTIKEIRFEGQGCAISTASCSFLIEQITGKKITELPELSLAYMHSLLGIQVTLARQKCVMLAARAIKNTLEQ